MLHPAKSRIHPSGTEPDSTTGTLGTTTATELLAAAKLVEAGASIMNDGVEFAKRRMSAVSGLSAELLAAANPAEAWNAWLTFNKQAAADYANQWQRALAIAVSLPRSADVAR